MSVDTLLAYYTFRMLASGGGKTHCSQSLIGGDGHGDTGHLSNRIQTKTA
jgi:hypothetical protein